MILQPGKLYVVKVKRTLYSETSSTLSNPEERFYIQQLDKNTIVMLVEHMQVYSWSDCKLLTPDGVSGWIFFPTRQIEDIFKEP